MRVDWDPAAGDVEVTIDHGEGRGETVLHGGASGTIDDQGQLSWDAAADPEPVTHLSPEFQARIAQMIFGVWKDGDDTWMIRPPDGWMPGREVAELPEKAVEVAELRERISELRATRVHVWEGPGGGRVIQKEYKDLRSLGDYEYLRDESRAFNAEEIAALEARLAEMQAETGRGWFAGNDPLGMSRADRRDRARQPIHISVIEGDGYRFEYDSAEFDGERVTARRTLRDVRDISELPQRIIDELVASWSPPEWIELAAVYDVRSKTVSLGGKRWRMHVTYGGGMFASGVSSIHTPYSIPLALNWDDGGSAEANEQAVVLSLKTVDGAPLEGIAHDVPFIVEAEYLTRHDVPGVVMMQIDDREGQIEIDLWPVYGEGGEMAPYRLRSSPMYLRSVQFTERPLEGGLYTDQHFVDEPGLEAAIGEWQRETQASDPLVARNFSGDWSVTHLEGDKGFVGRATVAEDGRSARLALVDEEVSSVTSPSRSAPCRAASRSRSASSGFWPSMTRRSRAPA